MKKYGSLHRKDQIFCQTLEPGIAGKFRPSFDLESPKIEAYNLLQDIQKTKIYSLSKIVNAGYKNYELIDWLNPFIDFSLLNLPPVWIEDTITNSLEPYSFFKYENNQLRDFNLDKCFEELSSGQSWVERFSEACI